MKERLVGIFFAYAVFHHMVFTACRKVIIRGKVDIAVVIKLVVLLKDVCVTYA